MRLALVTFFLIWCPAYGAGRKFWLGKKFTPDNPTKYPVFKEVNSSVQTLWFDQLLDHNDPTNPTTWKQRYYVNDGFFKNDNGTGPVFLLIGGEGEATVGWMMEGAWMHYTQQYGALCFQLEHRFYGKSRPAENLSIKSLAYLSSEQALADLAYFFKAMNVKYQLSRGNRWIGFGGSYAGSLAAWVREKYPYLVHGSISTSGPLLAKIDFKEFFEVVVDSLKRYSSECVEDVQSAMSQVETLLTHRIGQRNLNEMFKLCDPVEQSISNDFDISNLFQVIAANFAAVVQYNTDNSPHARFTIDEICDVMMNKSIGAPVSRLAAVNEMIIEQDDQECLDFVYDKTIRQLQKTSWDSDVANGARQWTYQSCNEFGFYQTSDNPSSVFGDRFPVDFFVRQCMDVFGRRFDQHALNRAVYRTNTNYGALNPSTTNVLYVHGSIDPWHRLGLINSDDINMPTIFIDGTAHCASMYEPMEDDSPQLKSARTQISSFIGTLLKVDHE